MNYIKTFELYKYEDDIIVKSFTQDEYKSVLFKNGQLKDNTYYSRIMYADDSDFGWNTSDLNTHFIVMFKSDEIIGVCKIANYDNKNPKKMDISYCSIDRRYRGKGYLKFIIKELMDLCLKNDFKLGSSSWTVPGYLKLRPTLIKYAKQYGVEFEDHNRMHDYNHMYNRDLISRSEMTDEEIEKYNKGDVYGDKPLLLPEKMMNIFSYYTGKYKIYSTQKGFDYDKVDDINKEIKYGSYRYKEDRGVVAGHRNGNDIYITEGHHRMMAALKYWLHTNDYSPVEKLVGNGIFNDKKPLNYYKFPLSKLNRTDESLYMLNESVSSLVSRYKEEISDINKKRDKEIEEISEVHRGKFIKYINDCVKKFGKVQLNDPNRYMKGSEIGKMYSVYGFGGESFLSFIYSRFGSTKRYVDLGGNYTQKTIDVKQLIIDDLIRLVELVSNSKEITEFTSNVLRKINESKQILKDPKWFYVVLRNGKGRESDNKYRVWESLSRGTFEGLRGISDNTLIAKAWFDIREIMLVMPADKVKKLNDITQIEYFNPDQLVFNNFEILIRIFDNERINGDDYKITSTLTKMFQNMGHINYYKSIGSKKRSRIGGTWEREPSHSYISDIIHIMNQSGFYYKIGDFISSEIKKGHKINNVKDISNCIEKYIMENRNTIKMEEYGKRSILGGLINHYDLYGTKYITKVLNWCLNVTGKIYNKREGEWIVNSDEFIVPDNSYLFIKNTPSYDDEESYNKWRQDLKKWDKNESSSESRGLTDEEISEFVDNYNLEEMYRIQKVKHSYEMYEILKNNFN